MRFTPEEITRFLLDYALRDCPGPVDTTKITPRIEEGMGASSLTPVTPTPELGNTSLVKDLYFDHANAAQTLALAMVDAVGEQRSFDKYMPVYFLVGATSSTGDAVGPLVGWFLKRKGFTGEYLGDLNEPVHATNIKEKLNEAWMRAMKRNKFPYIIAVDAAVGRPGRITVNRGPLKPGAGMGKNLPQVGSIHIMGGTANFPFMIWFTGLETTLPMAEVIADGLIQFHEMLMAGSDSLDNAAVGQAR